jgi:hypothetical protein
MGIIMIFGSFLVTPCLKSDYGFLSRRGLIVARHEVPGNASSKGPSRRVRYDRAQLIPEVFLHKICAVFLKELLLFQSSNRCAHFHESDRTLRDGSFGVALSQALRARLRSHRPSGTFRNRL